MLNLSIDFSISISILMFTLTTAQSSYVKGLKMVVYTQNLSPILLHYNETYKLCQW